MYVYVFYYTDYEQTSTDMDSDSVYSNVRYDLPDAFVDFKIGYDYYKCLYPNKNIEYKLYEVIE